MKPNRTFAALLAAGLTGGLALFLISCATTPPWVNAPLEIPGAHYVGNQVCFDCHTNLVRQFKASPHARLYLANHQPPGGTGCESCHGPGSKHVEAGGGHLNDYTAHGVFASLSYRWP